MHEGARRLGLMGAGYCHKSSCVQATQNGGWGFYVYTIPPSVWACRTVVYIRL
jgi:hypothetical protein